MMTKTYIPGVTMQIWIGIVTLLDAMRAFNLIKTVCTCRTIGRYSLPFMTVVFTICVFEKILSQKALLLFSHFRAENALLKASPAEKCFF